MDDLDRDLLVALAESARISLDYVAGQGRAWATDGKTVDAVAKRLEEVGELAKRVNPSVLASLPGVDWRGVRAFREVLAHDYGRLDLDVLADIVDNKVPTLLKAVEAALEAEL